MVRLDQIAAITKHDRGVYLVGGGKLYVGSKVVINLLVVDWKKFCETRLVKVSGDFYTPEEKNDGPSSDKPNAPETTP